MIYAGHNIFVKSSLTVSDALEIYELSTQTGKRFLQNLRVLRKIAFILTGNNRLRNIWYINDILKSAGFLSGEKSENPKENLQNYIRLVSSYTGDRPKILCDELRLEDLSEYTKSVKISRLHTASENARAYHDPTGVFKELKKEMQKISVKMSQQEEIVETHTEQLKNFGKLFGMVQG